MHGDCSFDYIMAESQPPRVVNTSIEGWLLRVLRLSAIAASGLLSVGVLWGAAAEAVSTCRVRVHAKSGTIYVSAMDVSGTLRWGDRSGTTRNAFANESECVVGAEATHCTLGAPGTLQAIIPPDLCVIYLKDEGPECAAFIKGCTPGVRPGDPAKADALKELVNAISFHHSVPTLEFSGINIQIVSGSGATAGPENGAGNLIIGYNEPEGAERECLLRLPCLTCSGACQSDADCPPNLCVLSEFGSMVCGLTDSPCFQNSDCTPNRCDPRRGGSHNLVIGQGHSYASYGGLIAGRQNTLASPSASVVGGFDNRVASEFGSIAGGMHNQVSGISTAATVTGGEYNRAMAEGATVSGGYNNTASGMFASVTAGGDNIAGGAFSSVSGGDKNWALDQNASVSGGVCNTAGGDSARGCPMFSEGGRSAICGGSNNLSRGYASTVMGGDARTILSDLSTASGPLVGGPLTVPVVTITGIP